MAQSILWIPETAKELLAVDLQEPSTATDDDWIIATFINTAIVDWLNGQLDTGTLTDILLQHGIEPAQHLDAAENYFHSLVRHVGH